MDETRPGPGARAARITRAESLAHDLTGHQHLSPRHRRLAVIDPGPADPAHLRRCSPRSPPASGSAISSSTHAHLDHSAARARSWPRPPARHPRLRPARGRARAGDGGTGRAWTCGRRRRGRSRLSPRHRAVEDGETRRADGDWSLDGAAHARPFRQPPELRDGRCASDRRSGDGLVLDADLAARRRSGRLHGLARAPRGARPARLSIPATARRWTIRGRWLAGCCAHIATPARPQIPKRLAERPATPQTLTARDIH